jgi:hypothetical protein
MEAGEILCKNCGWQGPELHHDTPWDHHHDGPRCPVCYGADFTYGGEDGDAPEHSVQGVP